MDKSITQFYSIRPPDSYEQSHEARLDFLIKDLGLDMIEKSVVGDFGCGTGRLLHKMPRDRGNTYHGFDGADVPDSPYLKDFTFWKVDLNNPFTPWAKNDGFLDVAFCFEVWEHLESPYRCVFEIKRLLKLGGILYCSIPAEDSLHNCIYPSLMYPKENFMLFLRQMAFDILDVRRHDKAFSQNVFILRNMGWEHSRMVFPKSERKFFGIPPHVSVNL